MLLDIRTIIANACNLMKPNIIDLLKKIKQYFINKENRWFLFSVSSFFLMVIFGFAGYFKLGFFFANLMVVLFTLDTTTSLKNIDLKTLKGKLQIIFFLFTNYIYSFYLLFVYTYLFTKEDIWHGIFISLVVVIAINYMQLWCVLSICKTIRTILFLGVWILISIELILYGVVGLLMVDDVTWEKIESFPNFFDSFIMIFNVGLEYINQLPIVKTYVDSKHMLVYCLGNATHFISMAFFVSYITSSIFKLENNNKL